MSAREKLFAWLKANRSSARLAFLLRTMTLGLGALLAVIWARLLLHTLGAAVFGNWILFQRALRLAGLGDFGLSGGLALRAGQLMGRGEDDKLRHFLASARSALLLMAAFLGVGMCVLAPWLPGWLKFQQIPGSGSFTLLFIVGGATLAAGLIAGYFNSLNAAYATVTWPVLPVFLLGQLTWIGQWTMARTGAPLWMQAISPLATTIMQAALLWWMLRVAHSWLGQITPLGRDTKLWGELMTASGWIYLYSLGNVIYTSTDSFLINAAFGPAAVTPYQLNYRLVEIAVQLIGSASFIGQSKINLLIHSPEPELRERARASVQRLCVFQSWLGLCAALGYLAVDNLFIKHVFGDSLRMSSPVQWMFALNLAITMGGDAAIQIAGLCGPKGLRTAGLTIGLTALLNLGLSFIAMKFGSLLGIAGATVIAQTILSLFLGWYTCRHLNISIAWWMFRSCLLPAFLVIAGAALHGWIGSVSFSEAALLLGAFLPLALAQAWLGGVDRAFLRHELSILRSFLPR